MRTLPQEKLKNGYIYRLVDKWTNPQNGKSIAIYSQHTKKGTLIAHEVFLVPVLTKDGMTPTGYFIEAGEKFPSNTQFGISGDAAAIVGDTPKSLKRVYGKFEQFKQNTYAND